jgi:outer membrane protein assembly factor BamB
VTAYRADTGAQVWRNEQLSYRGLSAPVVWSSYLAIGDRDGYVHVLSQVDGSFVARYKIGDTVRSLMASRGKSLYVLSDNGTVTALKIAD